MTQSAAGFAIRFGFARWLYHLRHGEAPSGAAIAKEAGRTGQWVTLISRQEDAPRDYTVHAPVAAYLGVPDGWLFRGEGEAPEPDLWGRWLAQRTGIPVAKGYVPRVGPRPPNPADPETPRRQPDQPAGATGRKRREA